MRDVARVRAQFLRCFDGTWNEALGWENARFVVLDTESSGVDPRRDSIVSIGAVGAAHFELRLDDSFEVFVPISHNTAAVHVHGITREMAFERGLPEPEAIALTLDYLRDAIIVGHHVSHDVEMIERACRKHFDIERLPNLAIDTMDLALRLEQMGRLKLGCIVEDRDYSLDALCNNFGIPLHDRHTAMGDAFLTGQVFLKLLRRAKDAGLLRLGQLTERFGEGCCPLSSR